MDIKKESKSTEKKDAMVMRFKLYLANLVINRIRFSLLLTTNDSLVFLKHFVV